MSHVSVNGQLTGGPAFQIGAVLSKTFSVLAQHFGKFFLLALIPVVPAILLASASPAMDENATAGLVILGALIFIATMVLSVLAQATALYGAFQAMRGQSFTIQQSIQAALSRLGTIVGVAIMSTLAMALGTLLLVVPGIIIGCMLFVSMPACVIEKHGVMDSLRRSRELTKGYRWQIFGILALLMVIAIVIAFALAFLFGGTWISTVLEGVWQIVSTAVSAVLVAVIYHDLRAAKEGIDIDRMVSVFD